MENQLYLKPISEGEYELNKQEFRYRQGNIDGKLKCPLCNLFSTRKAVFIGIHWRQDHKIQTFEGVSNLWLQSRGSNRAFLPIGPNTIGGKFNLNPKASNVQAWNSIQQTEMKKPNVVANYITGKDVNLGITIQINANEAPLPVLDISPDDFDINESDGIADVMKYVLNEAESPFKFLDLEWDKKEQPLLAKSKTDIETQKRGHSPTQSDAGIEALKYVEAIRYPISKRRLGINEATLREEFKGNKRIFMETPSGIGFSSPGCTFFKGV